MLVKAFESTGDTSELKEKILFHATKEDLKGKAFALLAVSDPSLAEKVIIKQNYLGDWEEDVYLTALISYALLEHGLEINKAQSGLFYLVSVQNNDGSWGRNGKSSIQETALALLVLNKGNFSYGVKEKAMEWLLRHQNNNGSWGNNNISTAWAMMAIAETEAYNQELIEKKEQALKQATGYLKKAINFDGGWGLNAGEKSDPFATSLVLLTLQKYDCNLLEVAKGVECVRALINDKAWIRMGFAFNRLTEILYLLKNDQRSIPLKTQYRQWLMEFPEQDNNEYLARKISFVAREGGEVTEELTRLLAGRNNDGGWGLALGYESSPWDTALVLRAFLDAGIEDLSLYHDILAFLYTHRNHDGSYSIKRGDDGHFYLTALLVEELERLNKFLDCSYMLTPAKQWLINQRDYTGAYGDSLLETARAFAVTMEQLSPIQLENTLNLIETKALPNGSWEDDPLTTAAVLAVLWRLLPDLSVTSDDLIFQPVAPYVHDQVDIKVTVHNYGFAMAENVEVKLYHGETRNGVLVDRRFISQIPVNGSETISFIWEAKEAGNHLFTVVIDPDNRIREVTKSNNQAAKTLRVDPKIDLAITSEDIQVIHKHPSPANTILIKAQVHNLGYSPANEFSVLFSKGNPVTGGEVLGSVKVGSLAGQTTTEVILETTLPEGECEIHVIIDPEDVAKEDRLDNNHAFRRVIVDWTAPETDILLTGEEGPDGSFRSNVTVTLTSRDNPGGSGVALTYYRVGTDGNYQVYIEPFILTQEGTVEIYFYSVDQAGNEEAPQRVMVKIQKAWHLPYSLLCRELTIYGYLAVDRAFVNGPVRIYGHCNLDYLGTTENEIFSSGPSTIKLLETGLLPQEIPIPDWERLCSATILQQKNQISQDTILNNLRFANDLQISGTTRIKGLLVVEGDLQFHGDVILENTGIYCAGTITFNGNVSGSGLIYAGEGLMIHGNPQINGMIIADGPVTGSGSVGNAGVAVEEYLRWFK